MRMPNPTRLLCLTCVALAAISPAAQERAPMASAVTAIRHVTVVPMAALADERLERHTVVVEGERIAQIAPDASAVVPPGTRVIDGTGRYLAPGLIDLHVHLSKTRASALPLFVAHGVTTVRDMGGDYDELIAWRRDIEDGVRLGPRMAIAGPYLESTRNIERMRKDPPEARVEPFERTRIGVGSPADAAQVIAAVAARGIDFIKIRTVQDRDTYAALNAAANAHRIPLVGHVTGLPPQFVQEVGQDGIDHFFYPSIDDPTERAGVWRQFASRGVPIVPTIGVLAAAAFPSPAQLRAIAEDDAGTLEPRRRYISRYMVLDWREQASEASDARRAEQQRLWETVIRRDLREMHAAGMDVLVGTDTAVVNVYPGSSIYDEMALFVSELGMTPAEVLDRTTRKSARFLKRADSIGTIERGKIADLVLLDADPLADISNVRRIAAVFVRGRAFDREALQGLKADVLGAADVKADDWGRSRKSRGR